jgi:hypothetical protein
MSLARLTEIDASINELIMQIRSLEDKRKISMELAFMPFNNGMSLKLAMSYLDEKFKLDIALTRLRDERQKLAHLIA